MRQIFMVKEKNSYSVRVTSQSGCTSEIYDTGLTRRAALGLIAKLNAVRFAQEDEARRRAAECSQYRRSIYGE